LGLAEDTLCEVSAALEAQGEGELALVFLEKLVRLNPAYRERLREAIARGLAGFEGCSLNSRDQDGGRYKRKLLDLKKMDQSFLDRSVTNSTPSADVRFRFTIGISLIFGMVVLGVGVWVSQSRLFGIFRDATSYKLALSRETTVYQGRVPSLRPPEIERGRSPNLQGLMGILYSLDKDDQLSAEPLPSDMPKILQNGGRAKLNLNSPLEPSEVRVALQEGEAASPQQHLEAGSYREPMVRGYSRKDPIVPGDLVAGSARSEDYRKEMIYEVIAATPVLAQPSEGAFEVGRLRPGDLVRVDERMGRWLKVLSRARREGYILSKSARPHWDK